MSANPATTTPTTSGAPAAPSVNLNVTEPAANEIKKFMGTEEGLRIWLNMESEDLGGATPMTLIKEGDGEVVATLLEDAMLGQPG